MRIAEQARCLGFVSAIMTWPDPPAATMTPPRSSTAGGPGMSPGKRPAEAELLPIVNVMAAESDPRVLEEIRALEQRLAVLKDREQKQPGKASDASWVREEAHRRGSTAEAAP